MDLSGCVSFIYIYIYWGIILMHVFTFFLKVGFHWTFPRDCTVGTSLGVTTKGILGGYPGRVLSSWYQSSRFLNSLGLYIVVQLIQCFVYLHNLIHEIDSVSFILGKALLPDGAQR